MSTRSVIARKTDKGFKGVYHHWDGYPTGLGATLFELRNGHFKGDTDAMLKALIDAHPAGWSTINGADFTLEPGFDMGNHPACYCHGKRSEKGQVVTQRNASDIGCEWAYVFTENGTMEVQSSFCESGNKMIGMFGCGDPDATWQTVAVVDLNAAEPDWKAIEAKAYGVVTA